MFNKNKEDVLGLIMHISYYYANELYYIRKEDTCTSGRTDLIFTPRNNKDIPIVIELKADDSVDAAMNQIKNRNYLSVFQGYHRKTILLAIVYDSKSLKHQCKIEYIDI